jgi:hypothetical protein
MWTIRSRCVKSAGGNPRGSASGSGLIERFQTLWFIEGLRLKQAHMKLNRQRSMYGSSGVTVTSTLPLV